MYFLQSNPIAFINAVTPFESALIVFCATTLGTLTIIASVIFLFFRPEPGRGIFASLKKISERVQDLFLVAIPTVGAYLSAVLLKNYFMIARPAVLHPQLHALILETDYGFPSGHASTFSALAVSLFFVDRRAGYAGAAIALIIGIARIFAGVHTPLDIIGGYVLGSAIALLVDSVATVVNRKPALKQ